MKVENMESSRGNKVANQFIITDDRGTQYFQSYDTIIAKMPVNSYRIPKGHITYEYVELDNDKWDYSKTTGVYRNQFLGETRKETQAKIDSGEYKLVNLN